MLEHKKAARAALMRLDAYILLIAAQERKPNFCRFKCTVIATLQTK
jgi:hypothetical protein